MGFSLWKNKRDFSFRNDYLNHLINCKYIFTLNLTKEVNFSMNKSMKKN